MEENKNTPQIRFKGFTEDWEQCKLLQLGEFKSNGVDKLSKENEISVNLLNYMDVYNKIKVYNKNASNLMQVTAKKNQIIENNILKGDVFFTPTSETADDIGHAMVIEETLEKTVYSYHLMRFRPFKNKFSLLYPNYCFDIHSVREQMRLSAQGVQRFVLNKNSFENIDILLPKIEEQEKISIMLTNIDNLITLHHSKYDKLLKVKKSILEKIFPQEGEKIPKWRFIGFCDSWEQCKLLSTIECIVDYRGRTPKKLEYDWSDSGILALSALNVKMGFIDTSLEAHYGDDYLYSLWMKDTPLHKGQVLLTTEAPAGNVAQIPDNNRYILSQRTIAFKVKEKIICDDYLAKVLSSPNIQTKISNLSTGGTAKGVSQKTLSEIDILLPRMIKEQKQISTFISTLDNLITLHQSKLEKLNNIKKSLLEKMFV